MVENEVVVTIRMVPEKGLFRAVAYPNDKAIKTFIECPWRRSEQKAEDDAAEIVEMFPSCKQWYKRVS